MDRQLYIYMDIFDIRTSKRFPFPFVLDLDHRVLVNRSSVAIMAAFCPWTDSALT